MIFKRKTYQVNLQDQTIEIRKGETILNALKRQDMKPPYFCEGGACGVCSTLLLEGEVLDTRDNQIVSTETGSKIIFPCVSRALSDLQIVYEHQLEELSC